MNWIELENTDQLNTLKEKSFGKAQVIFKHSRKCSISSVALNRLERETDLPDAEFYYLDLIQHRNISNEIAEMFRVEHESPQILLIKNGTCIYSESHYGIAMDEIAEAINA